MVCEAVAEILTRTRTARSIPLELEETDTEASRSPICVLANRPVLTPPGRTYLHKLMMDATSDECLGKEFKQYAETAVVPAIMENAMNAQAIRMAIQCSVC